MDNPQLILIWTRIKRTAKRWLLDAFTETLAPLTDASARLNYIGVLVVVLLLSPRWGGSDRHFASVISAAEAVQAAIYSIPLFFTMNLLLAGFRIRRQERERGQWFGPRFVYHEPVRMLTVLVDEHDNGKPVRFSIPDAEDDSFVTYAIEVDGATGRVAVELAWENGQRPADFGNPMHSPKGGIRLPRSRRLSLLTHVEPGSILSTVRVFMTGWEVGKGRP